MGQLGRRKWWYASARRWERAGGDEGLDRQEALDLAWVRWVRREAKEGMEESRTVGTRFLRSRCAAYLLILVVMGKARTGVT